MNQQLFFQERFKKIVEAGKKRQTIRPASEFREKLKVGDLVYLRSWIGAAYRSKQEKLGTGRVTEKFEIEWTTKGFYTVDPNNQQSQEKLAMLDGFGSLREMYDWFEENHPEPKKMVVIRWELETPQDRKGGMI